MDRRQALWEVSALHDRPIALFQDQDSESKYEAQISLPLMEQSEHVVYDYYATTLSLKAHPVSFLREELNTRRVMTAAKLQELPNGAFLKVAGLVNS